MLECGEQARSLCNYNIADVSQTRSTLLSQVGQRQSNLRQLQVGGKYTLPPPANGLAPSANQPASEWRDIVRQAAQQVILTSVLLCAASPVLKCQPSRSFCKIRHPGCTEQLHRTAVQNTPEELSETRWGQGCCGMASAPRHATVLLRPRWQAERGMAAADPAWRLGWYGHSRVSRQRWPRISVRLQIWSLRPLQTACQVLLTGWCVDWRPVDRQAEQQAASAGIYEQRCIQELVLNQAADLAGSICLQVSSGQCCMTAGWRGCSEWRLTNGPLPGRQLTIDSQ